ncbi:hypothetical protein JMM81_20835 [Bacillus sp. V3B]|uniref:hypothetical protein n=1 Tax=Bacillus sp. V3B TaxID=2804915 RepID=UPI00210CDD80|nr:hypothetical protein [Bacillus sp. V3B]MCQ6277322.1 hypothetical protein [Bacillus sp. V3B]
MKAIELEELYRLYYVQKHKRIELFGSQLEQIITELNKRDLSEVQTEKLLELKLKYLDFLKREEIELTLQIEEEMDFDQTLASFNKSIKVLNL